MEPSPPVLNVGWPSTKTPSASEPIGEQEGVNWAPFQLQYVTERQTWVKYIIDLHPNTFLSFTELVECIGTYGNTLKFKPHLLVLLVGSFPPGMLRRSQKSNCIQNDYVFGPGLVSTVTEPVQTAQGKLTIHK